ncbi:MAG TPA: endonuclease NucS [Fibrobacteria bacterium]|nr:endonuclease NucS [Fibrobacteria bacterium]
MSIQHAIWCVGDEPKPLTTTRLASEQQLEEMISKMPEILSREWMLIGRQERTDDGGRIDLLAITPDGSLVLIELKRDRTPREVVAQALDYAEWVSRLTEDRIAQIFARYSKGKSLSEEFSKRFRTTLDEEALNKSHQIVVVASELDPSTERIVSYLNAKGIAINVLFFQVFQHGQELLLSRAWMIAPEMTQANASQIGDANSNGPKEPWNGEFYVSLGGYHESLWRDAKSLGFICGGGGLWYSQTLKLLQPGDRIWVKIPGKGFVGVGKVLEPVQPVTQFTVSINGGDVSILDALTHPDPFRTNADDPEKCDYFVRIQWSEAIDASEAFDELGLFGNQNTVCRPTTPKWRHTVERLKTKFTDWDRG